MHAVPSGDGGGGVRLGTPEEPTQEGGSVEGSPLLLASDSISDAVWGLSDTNPLACVGTDMSNAYGNNIEV